MLALAAGPESPERGATQVDLAELRARGIVLDVRPAPDDPSVMIPRSTDYRIQRHVVGPGARVQRCRGHAAAGHGPPVHQRGDLSRASGRDPDVRHELWHSHRVRLYYGVSGVPYLRGSGVLCRVGALAAIVAASLLMACQEDVDEPPVEPPPAQVISVAHARGNNEFYLAGEEMRLTFNRDPGPVEVLYGGRRLAVGVVGEGVERAFLVLSLSATFTWQGGGSFEMEFTPMIHGDADYPSAWPLFPGWDAIRVSPTELMDRGVTIGVSPPFESKGAMIPRIRMSQPTITASDGRTWEPEFTTELDELTLLSDPDNPFLSGQTYVVRVDVWLTALSSYLTPFEFEFTTE